MDAEGNSFRFDIKRKQVRLMKVDKEPWGLAQYERCVC